MYKDLEDYRSKMLTASIRSLGVRKMKSVSDNNLFQDHLHHLSHAISDPKDHIVDRNWRLKT